MTKPRITAILTLSLDLPPFRRGLHLVASITATSIITHASMAQTMIGIHDFEPSNASPAMHRTTSITGSPYFSEVFTGNSSNSYNPPNSPYFATGEYGFLHWGPNIAGTSSTTVTHVFGAVDTRNHRNVSVSIRVASLNGSQGVDTADYCEISVSPDNGASWYQQLRLTGNASAYWAFSGTGTINRTFAPNNDFTTTMAPGGGLLTGVDAITTMTVSGLPSVQNLRIRVQTAVNSSAEGWCIDDVKILGTHFPAPTVIASSPATVEFRFNAAVGVNYRIETSTDLIKWNTNETNIAGEGQMVSRFYATEKYPKRYFRVGRN